MKMLWVLLSNWKKPTNRLNKMQSSYFKTSKEKTRKFRREYDDEHQNRQFEKKREKYRDERRKQKRPENWG